MPRFIIERREAWGRTAYAVLDTHGPLIRQTLRVICRCDDPKDAHTIARLLDAEAAKETPCATS